MNLIHPPEKELICDAIFRNRKNALSISKHTAKFLQVVCTLLELKSG